MESASETESIISEMSASTLQGMSEIELVENYYTAKDSRRTIPDNLRRRIGALNEFLYGLDDSPDYWFYSGEFQFKTTTTSLERCLCGKSIKNFYVITLNNTEAVVGSDCIKNFFPDMVLQHQLDLRTTYDCLDCKKRVNKNDMSHGVCTRPNCNNKVKCKFTLCYTCRFPVENKQNICQLCQVPVKGTYKLCYLCNKKRNQ